MNIDDIDIILQNVNNEIKNINDIKNEIIIFDEEINKDEINNNEEDLEFDIILENPDDIK